MLLSSRAIAWAVSVDQAALCPSLLHFPFGRMAQYTLCAAQAVIICQYWVADTLTIGHVANTTLMSDILQDLADSLAISRHATVTDVNQQALCGNCSLQKTSLHQDLLLEQTSLASQFVLSEPGKTV